MKKLKTDDSYIFRTDNDKTFTRKTVDEFTSLFCDWEQASPYMEDIMPFDFSIWREVNKRMIEQEKKWPKRKFSKTETKNQWTKRLIDTLHTLDTEYIDHVSRDVYRRVKEMHASKGGRPYD